MSEIDRIVVAVPARNEAATLARCLASITTALDHPDLAGYDAVVVVAADDCTDATEAIVDQVIREFAAAQSTGIEVEEVLREAVRRMPEAENGARDTRRMRARRALMGMCEGGDAPYWIEDGCITVM